MRSVIYCIPTVKCYHGYYHCNGNWDFMTVYKVGLGGLECLRYMRWLSAWGATSVWRNLVALRPGTKLGFISVWTKHLYKNYQVILTLSVWVHLKRYALLVTSKLMHWLKKQSKKQNSICIVWSIWNCFRDNILDGAIGELAFLSVACLSINQSFCHLHKVVVHYCYLYYRVWNRFKACK